MFLREFQGEEGGWNSNGPATEGKEGRIRRYFIFKIIYEKSQGTLPLQGDNIFLLVIVQIRADLDNSVNLHRYVEGESVACH